MDTLSYILQKYSINLDNRRMPIEIPNVGRDDLAVLFHELGFTIGAEIGTEQGLYAETLCKGNPNLHLYCVDPWKSYRGYLDHITQEKLDNFYEIAKARLAPYNVELVRKFSMEAVKDFKRNSLDFVYIDANHEFRYIVEDLCEWPAKVRPGGIIAGHDFCQRKDKGYHVHVVEAVMGYTSAYKISPWFVLGTKAIVPNETRDSTRSFFWVKE